MEHTLLFALFFANKVAMVWPLITLEKRLPHDYTRPTCDFF